MTDTIQISKSKLLKDIEFIIEKASNKTDLINSEDTINHSENITRSKNSDYISLKEAAEYLNVHVGTLYRYVKSGTIPFTKVGSRTLISTKALNEYLEKNSYQGA